jgi:WD40 repeat protein
MFSCSHDNTATLHSYNLEDSSCQLSYNTNIHKAEVTSCAVHPLGYIVAVASKDQTFSFHDVSAGKKLAHFSGFEKESAYKYLKAI